jgi:hypothetical protein
MDTRVGYDFNGKKHEFKTDGVYFCPNSDTNEIFDGGYSSKFNAAILYTKIVEDKGYKVTNRYGIPYTENYNNGLVGYQCLNYYDTIEEAQRELVSYKELSPKVGVVAYVDVWLAINKNK